MKQAEEPQAAPGPVAVWLLGCCGMIFAMVVVGGITRLTRSGLSITEWAPILGALPPLNLEQWEEAFRKYQATPEFKLVNHQMSLDEFKGIFYVEWAHRLLGRSIGLAFGLPLVWFWLRKQLPVGLAPRLGVFFVLGGLQGALGWYMVASGLVDIPQVSPYRLTAHLGLAILLYMALLWTALDLLRSRVPLAEVGGLRPLLVAARWLVAGVYLMCLSGGFVAGTKAGFAFNTFPLMGEHWVPPGLWVLEPGIRNFFENVTLVQFNHRLGALGVSVAIAGLAVYARRFDLSMQVRMLVLLLVGMVGLQATLGISTLLWVVPIPLAAAHQGGALLLLTLSMLLAHALQTSDAVAPLLARMPVSEPNP